TVPGVVQYERVCLFGLTRPKALGTHLARTRALALRAQTMALPRPTEARLYYRAAKQRYDDAELLLEAGRTTGAVYLAGYTVECFLKALVLAGVAPGLRKRLLREFRGSRAHEIEWLGALYRRH